MELGAYSDNMEKTVGAAWSTLGRLLAILIVFTLGLPGVSSQTGSTDNTTAVSTISTTQSWYPKCVTSCVGDVGENLPTGNYANCNHCNSYISCVNGILYLRDCPLGTSYYDRVLGVCVMNSNVCINDSLTTTTSPAVITAPSQATTSVFSTTTVDSTASAVTTTGVETTKTDTSTVQDITATTTSSQSSLTTTESALTTQQPITTMTATTQTAAVSTNSTATTSTTQSPATVTTSTSNIQTLSTQLITASTVPTATTTTTTASSVTTTSGGGVNTGFTPQAGGEATSYWFALELYNRLSQDSVRAVALNVNSVTTQTLNSNVTWYRLYGVTLVQSSCPNTEENMKADYQKCPLSGASSGSNQQFVSTCNFKIQYSSQSSELSMVYMMCYK